MNTLLLKRHYKFLLLFFIFLATCIIFGSTRIISYNFGEYATEIAIPEQNIENNIEIFDESIMHDVQLDISLVGYQNLILYYQQNSEKEYLMTDITIDGVVISDVGIKLKGNQVVLGDLQDIDVTQIDFSLLIKFDRYVPGQRYMGLSELSLISGELSSLKGKYIAGKMYNNYGVIAPKMSFSQMRNSDVLGGIYLLKEVVNEDFLETYYADENGLLYKAENSLSFSYLGLDPVEYSGLFTQKTLVNNYDLKKLMEILEFVTLSGNTSFVDDFEKYINIENYTKFLAINDILYGKNDTLSLLNSYYIYYDLDSQTISFIPWDGEYIATIEETSIYEILEKVYSKQDITNITVGDIREILSNYNGESQLKSKQRFTNSLENNFLDDEGFEILYEAVKLELQTDLDSSKFIENLETILDTLLSNY